MKVLFASLVRIGDYIQHSILIRSYQEKFPNNEVHVLVNDLVPPELRSLNPKVKLWILPRMNLQKLSNDVNTPLLMPFWTIRNLVKDLKAENFDEVIDLTFQNQSLNFIRLISPDFSYPPKAMQLNHKFLDTGSDIHLLDFLSDAYHLAAKPKSAKSFKDIQRLYFQVMTSDEKKNIDLVKWDVLLNRLAVTLPNIEILVIGSKSDLPLLARVFGSRAEYKSFSDLDSDFTSGSVGLVTLDTSVKHFAALYGIPTVEISLGGSHPLSNSGYQSGNFVLTANLDCYPCSHSRPCFLGRNLCQDTISFDRLCEGIFELVTTGDSLKFSHGTEVKDSKLTLTGRSFWKKKKLSATELVAELVRKERELRELMGKTYQNEGFSKVNLLQRSLLEILKEQNLNENSDHSTRPTR